MLLRIFGRVKRIDAKAAAILTTFDPKPYILAVDGCLHGNYVLC